MLNQNMEEIIINNSRKCVVICMLVNPSFVFYPIAQHRNKLEIESLIRVEVSLVFSGFLLYAPVTRLVG